MSKPRLGPSAASADDTLSDIERRVREMEERQVAGLLRLAEVGREIVRALSSQRGAAGHSKNERLITTAIAANLAMALRITNDATGLCTDRMATKGAAPA